MLSAGSVVWCVDECYDVFVGESSGYGGKESSAGEGAAGTAYDVQYSGPWSVDESYVFWHVIVGKISCDKGVADVEKSGVSDGYECASYAE